MKKNHYYPHSSLKAIYSVRFLVTGAEKLLTNPVAMLAAMLYLAATVISVFLICPQDSLLAEMLLFLDRTAFIFIATLLALILLMIYGAPKGFARITQRLERVNGLFNADGESAVLISRQQTENGKVERWVFDTYGLPLTLFGDLRDSIENALDIAIIRMENGEDGHKIVMTVLPHPGPWPQLVPWDSEVLRLPSSQIALGVNRTEQVTVDLAERAHLLISGQTGSGKSVLLRSLMFQLLKKGHVIVLADYKRGVDYGPIWEQQCEMIFDDDAFIEKLRFLSDELDRRLELLRSRKETSIDQFNHSFGESIPHIVLVVDELAECLDKTGVSKDRKEKIEIISAYLSRLCRLGRAAGINCILSTQRGSSDYLSGQIRNNCYKIVGRCDENLALLTIGCTDPAKKLLYRGQFMDEHETMFQGYYADYSCLLAELEEGDAFDLF